MGNQPSGSSSDVGSSGRAAVRGFMTRSTGLLGLTKAELDERCKPSGLYPSSQWEDRTVRKLIGDGRLAARLKGTEHRMSPTDRECPICFLQYREINVTKCCSAHVCTECYLQVRPQKAKTSHCPFCNCSKMITSVAEAMNAEAMLAREESEQRVIEAKIRERAHFQDTTNNNISSNAFTPEEQENAPNSVSSSKSEPGFGSSLEQDERIASLRARSSSLSDHENNNCTDEIPEDVLRSSFAMSPEERRMLEDEMRAQHIHPLSLRLEAEAEERRIRNEQEYQRNNPASLIDSRRRLRRSILRSQQQQQYGSAGQERPRRDWNQIVEAFERGGHGEVNSLDDLVVLEAAMILSMEEEARQSGRDNADSSNATSTTHWEGNNNNNNNNLAFNAESHAMQGFPLVRSILSGRQQQEPRWGNTSEQSELLQSLVQRGLTLRRSGRNPLFQDATTDGSAREETQQDDNNRLGAALDSAGLLMRGLTEEDQLAMAIAASLQDQPQSGDNENTTDNEDSQTEEGDVEDRADNSSAESDQDGGNVGPGGDSSEGHATAFTNDATRSSAGEDMLEEMSEHKDDDESPAVNPPVEEDEL